MRKFIVTFLLVCSFLFLGNTDVFYADEFTLKLDGTEYTNTISEDNLEDYYKITLSQPGELTINLNAKENTDFAAYGDFLLLDADKKDVVAHLENLHINSAFSYHLKAGTYYVKIRAYASDDGQYFWSGGNYTLSATVDSWQETYAEINNTLATASKVEFNKDIYGQLAINDEIDIYRVELTKSGKLTFDIKSYLYEYEVQLCDKSGNPYRYVSNYCNEQLGYVEDSYDWELTAGAYYIKIEPYLDSYSQYCGNYNFKLTFTDAQETCAEPNNDKKSASAINFGQKIRGQFAINDAQDVYKVVTTKKCRLFFDITTYTKGYELIVADAQGKDVYGAYGYWDESVGKKDNEHYVDLPAGTYYITMNSIYSDTHGNYDMTVSTLNLLSECDVNVAESAYYTGSAVKVPITMEYEGYTLKEGTDYIAEYEYNVNFGTAYVTVTGIGKYAGSFEKSFKIVLKIGSKVNTGDYTYKFITDEEVALVAITNKNLTTVELDASAYIGGRYFTITEVSSKAAYNNAKITNLILPWSIEKIGEKAFYNCTKLKSVKFSSKAAIAKDAFTKCGKLTKVTGLNTGSTAIIGKNCYTVTEDGTFQFTKLYNTKDTSLTVPSTAKIGAASFKVTSIATKAVDKTKIKTATIGKYVSSIGDKAFQKCSSLTKVTFKGKNITAGAEVFDGCKKLKTIEGGIGSVFTVGKYKYKLTAKTTVAFAGIKSSSTTKVVIPPTVKIGAKTYKVTSVADYALYYSSVKSVEVGKNVKTIGQYACYGCGSLTKVIIKGKNLSIKTNAFSNCNKLKAFSGLTGCEVIIGNYKYQVTSGSTLTFKGIATDVDDVYIYANDTIGAKSFKVTAVADKALYKKDVVSVHVGANITKIGKQAFQGCSVLSELRIYTQKLKSVGSKAFYKTNKDMQVYIPSKKYKTYVKLLQGAGLSKKADYYKTY